MPRLFVALRPPSQVRETLLGAMTGIDRARWQDDDQLHLTLAFLGEVEGGHANDLAEALTDVESEEFATEISGVGHFERKGQPSAVWARVPLTEPLAQLQRRVERACRRTGLAPDKRGYRPHVTLARLSRRSGPIGGWLTSHGTLREGPWDVHGFTLYESHSRPEGSLYLPAVDYEF